MRAPTKEMFFSHSNVTLNLSKGMASFTRVSSRRSAIVLNSLRLDWNKLIAESRPIRSRTNSAIAEITLQDSRKLGKSLEKLEAAEDGRTPSNLLVKKVLQVAGAPGLQPGG